MCQFKKNLYKFLEYLDFDLDEFLNSKDQRIIFQKYGYFFKKYFHLNIGRYNLYLNGPYNPELAEVGFELANDKEYYSEKTSDINLPEKVVSTLNVLKEHFAFDSALLEVYCTYRYLRDVTEYDQEHSIEVLSDIKKDLMEKNPNCSKDNILELDKQLQDKIN